MAAPRYEDALKSFQNTPYQLRRKIAELISGQTPDGADYVPPVLRHVKPTRVRVDSDVGTDQTWTSGGLGHGFKNSNNENIKLWLDSGYWEVKANPWVRAEVFGGTSLPFAIDVYAERRTADTGALIEDGSYLTGLYMALAPEWWGLVPVSTAANVPAGERWGIWLDWYPKYPDDGSLLVAAYQYMVPSNREGTLNATRIGDYAAETVQSPT